LISRLLGAAVAGALLVAGAPAGAVDEAVRGLQGLRRVGVDITFSPAHPGVPVEDVQGRMEEILRAALPQAPALDPRSVDRLRLTVAVRALSTSELRGFYLPFSGVYGVGVVRLAVERMVTLTGIVAPVRAVVWQAERATKAAWRGSADEILGIAEDLTEDFVEDYRRALGR